MTRDEIEEWLAGKSADVKKQIMDFGPHDTKPAYGTFLVDGLGPRLDQDHEGRYAERRALARSGYGEQDTSRSNSVSARKPASYQGGQGLRRGQDRGSGAGSL